MAIRRVWLALPVLLLPIEAAAHEHSAECFFGGSGETGSTLLGFHGSYERTISSKGGSTRWGLVLGNVSFNSNESRDELTVLFGPRFTLLHREHKVSALIGVPVLGDPKIVLSAHALPLGFHKTHDNARSAAERNQSGGVFAVGVGLDVLFRKRPRDHIQSGLRVQVDYLRRYSHGPRHSARASVGMVLRYPHAHGE